MAADGSFVVTWQSHNQDGNGWGVYAQRYDATGNPLGGEFRVNTYTNNDQLAPSVAVASDGTFVIAWQSNGEDGSGWGVYAQRYDSNGNSLGGEFRVNTWTQDDQMAPSVAMAADDSFVVTWQSHNQGVGHWGIFAQRYSATGATVGGEFRVNTWNLDDQISPKVAMAGDGSFVVTWASHNQDGNGWGVYAQRFDPNGNALGGEFRVNTYTQDDQMAPSIAMAPDGTFVIAWQSHNQDGNGWGVYAQRYSSNGVAQGGEFLVNTTTNNDQMAPSAAMAADGSFFITWQSNNQIGNGWGVFGQRYSADGELNLSGGAGDAFVGSEQHLLTVAAKVSGVDRLPQILPFKTETGQDAVRAIAQRASTIGCFGFPSEISVIPSSIAAKNHLGSNPAADSTILQRPEVGTGNLIGAIFTTGSLDMVGTEGCIDAGASDGEIGAPRELLILDQEVPLTSDFPTDAEAPKPADMTRWQRACEACFANVEVATPAHPSASALGATGGPKEILTSEFAVWMALAGVTAQPRFWAISRLWPRPRRRPLVTERRSSRRFPCYLHTTCHQVGSDSNNPRTAIAWDLSARGVNLTLFHPFLPGSVLALELVGAELGVTRWLLARVVHVAEQQPGEWVVGCAFDRSLTEAELQSLLLGPAE
jgi:hypothetical protein